jgi:hypothetical protein
MVDALAPVITAFQTLGVGHYVGGSVASSFHGAARSTMDVDVVCNLKEEHVSPFVESFDSNFYIAIATVLDAVRRKSCFNLIHLPTSFKIDIFISRQRPVDVEAMRRAQMQVLGDDPSLNVAIASVEDSIVSKLEWYRLADETSDRQWDDVTRLVQLHGDALDVDYLENASQSVGVADLLTRLLAP